MKKIKPGIVEILGYIGLGIWVAVVFLREYGLLNNDLYLFFLSILPNLGAAWLVTMIGKWLVVLNWKQDYSVKKHLVVCISVVVLALVSEIIHDLFLKSPFDKYDILLTAVAQVFIFFLPIKMNDKYFVNYD
jgi:hypothetical protein